MNDNLNDEQIRAENDAFLREQAMKLAAQILIIAEALRPSMPRVSDLMDDAAITIGNLVDL